MARKKIIELSRDYSDKEIEKLCDEMQKWFFKKEDNMFLDDFLFIEKQIPSTDVENLKSNNQKFKVAIENANKIELAKLQKFAAGDRLNSSIIKQVLMNKHGWI